MALLYRDLEQVITIIKTSNLSECFTVTKCFHIPSLITIITLGEYRLTHVLLIKPADGGMLGKNGGTGHT